MEYAKTNAESQVALGFFDGVHLGHRAVIEDCMKNPGGRQSVVLTFAQSPAALLGKGEIPLITDNARKAELIGEMGVDAIILADFLQIREMEAEDFVTRVLYEQLRAKKVSCGYNYRFGKDGRGDTDTLRSTCEALGIAVTVSQPITCGKRTVSSSAVRTLLQNGDIRQANRMLGYVYSIRGRIGDGNHLGTPMGFPTVNLEFEKGMVVPRFGVYASRVSVGGKVYRGATNIGVHPTVGENDAPLCETFLLDRVEGDLRGEYAVCEPVAFVRQEKRFATTDALIDQVGRDVETIKEILIK